MKAFWVGAGTAATADTYNFLQAGGPQSWGSAEENRSNALSEDVVITKLTAWVTNAPGGATSWTFAIRDDAVDTAAAVTISGAATTASWSGAVAISAASLVAMVARLSGSSPVPSLSVYWIIEYTTAGDFYLMLANNYNITTAITGTVYLMPCGAANYTPNTAPGFHEGQAPTPFTVTRIAANVSGAPGVSSTRTFTPFFNRTTDAAFSAVITGTDTVAVSPPGSLAFTFESIAIKHVLTGTPATPRPTMATCLTIAPGIAGELAWFMSSNVALSNTAAEYNTFGPSNFGSIESDAAVRFPACTLKKLIVSLATAPGAGKSRTFTMRSNLADTAVLVPLSGTTSRAADTVDAAVHADGNFLSVRHAPAGTPAANSATGHFFVTTFDQGGVIAADTTKFFAFF